MYANSRNFKKGKFANQHPSPMDINYWKLFTEMIKKSPNRNPIKNILVEKIDSTNIENHNSGITQLTWFGHSAFLLEMDGKKILIDPMLGESPTPHPLLGPKRYSKELPIEIEKLPFIDAVILSHDHYDHLDYESIQKLKGKVGQYYTPLGVGNHLIKWGVAKEKIHELNWWDSINFDGIELVSCPARHFSGRGLFDRATTLWCSWVIKGINDNIYFSGDSGYDTHFKEIGEKYGPFDISLMECGQYNEDWKLLHMMPEETVQAAVDLKSKLILPIHWGAFTLAFHDWTDPIERVTIKAKELNMPITTPKIGEVVIIGDAPFPNEQWWTNYVPMNEN
jgi:L-ascorbate metabolism protein UlaG (beta-lactamase superfamily)